MRSRIITAAALTAALALTSIPGYVPAAAAETQPPAAAEVWNTGEVVFGGRTYNFTAEDGIAYVLCDGMKFDPFGHKAILVSAEGLSGEVIIPKTIPLPSYSEENTSATAEVTVIGENAFNNDRASVKKNTITSLTIPDSVEKIEESAFDNCGSIEEINAPDKYIELGWCNFKTTEWYREKLMSGTETVFCGNLLIVPDVEEYTVPDGVRCIHSAGDSLEKLKKLTIPEGVERVASSFCYCENLSEVTLPLSVREFGDSFRSCPGLDRLTVAGTAEEWRKTGRYTNRALALYDTDGNCIYEPSEEPTGTPGHFTDIENPEDVKTELSIGESVEISVTGGSKPYLKRKSGNEWIRDAYPIVRIDEVGRKDYSYFYTTVTYRITAMEPGICSLSFENAQSWASIHDAFIFTVSDEDGNVPDGMEKTDAGDANCDGKVNVSDAVTVLQYVANREKYPMSPQGMTNADIDGVRGITGTDAMVIQQIDADVYIIK